MSKKKNTTFKNPFDLDPEFEQEIITMTTTTKIQPNNVINPLPFNPYILDNQATQKPKKGGKVKEPQFVPQITQTRVPNRNAVVKAPKQTTQNQFYENGEQPKHERVYQPSQLNQDGDPPLLEDIGIDPNMIKKRAFMILKMEKPDQQTIQQSDLSGPILIALCFGILLLLSGKIHFGDIYAIFVVGNLLLYFLFNFMSQIQTISLYNIMSTMGYALIPMLILGFFGIFTSMKGTVGIILSLAVSGWSSFAASNFIQGLMKQTQTNRKPLLVYPLFLFYVSFAMIIIF